MSESLDRIAPHGTILSPVAPWRRQAACLGADPELFFRTRADGRGAVRQTIVTYCLECPVRLDCLEEGMKEIVGIWGGTTAKERRTLRRNAQHNIRLMKPSD